MKTAYRPALVVVLALVLLAVAGVTNRWVRASRAGSALTFAPLERPLAEIPSDLGNYTSRDVPLRDDVLQAAGVDEYIQREYVDADRGRRLLVYVGYWGRENTGLGHGPEVCYPAGGWRVDAPVREMPFPRVAGVLDDEARLSLHRFIRMEPEGISRCAVGFVAAMSGLLRPTSRGTYWHLPGHLYGENGHYLAQVHVTAFLSSGHWEPAERDIEEFMGLLIPELLACLPRTGK